MKPYQGMVPDVVSEIPHDINGLKYYIVDVPEEDPFCTKYKDGRYFELHSSSRKGFRGVRRVGKCSAETQNVLTTLKQRRIMNISLPLLGKTSFATSVTVLCIESLVVP